MLKKASLSSRNSWKSVSKRKPRVKLFVRDVEWKISRKTCTFSRDNFPRSGQFIAYVFIFVIKNRVQIGPVVLARNLFRKVIYFDVQSVYMYIATAG